MQAIAGEIALITGGASGIGRLLSIGMAEGGAKVLAWDIDEAALGRLEAEAKSRGLDITGMVCDVSDRRQVYEQAAEAAKRFGTIGILVNNAGIVSGKSLLETPDERIEKSMAVNALASFWTVKAFLPAMLERGAGSIVTISSAAGVVGVTGLADYSASKFAAFGFNEALRMELRKNRSPVRTLIVCPFFVNTGLFEGVRSKVPLLLPILEQEYVAKRILGAIAKGKKRLVLPWFVYSVWLLRLFPVGFMDAMAELFGISASMDHFTGRGAAARTGGKSNGK